MTETPTFTPQPHDLYGEDTKVGDLGEAANHLEDLANDLFAEVSRRRTAAAGLPGLGWRKEPHLAEHLAWLLAHETDALTAYCLYRAVLATHPSAWQLADWQRAVGATTPFPLLITAVLDDLAGEGMVDTEGGDASLIAHLRSEWPEERAQSIDLHRLDHSGSSPYDPHLKEMLRSDATIAEKSRAIRMVRFMSRDDADASLLAATKALFEAEKHPGLSNMAGKTLHQMLNAPCDAEGLAFAIDTYHIKGIEAAKDLLTSLLYGVEGYLLDTFDAQSTVPQGLADTLLQRFSASHPAESAEWIIDAIRTIAKDRSRPLAALSAVSWLSRCKLAEGAVDGLALEMAGDPSNAEAQGLAIRVLARKSGALLPLLDRLKEGAQAASTSPNVRRAMFDALVTPRSGLNVPREDVVELYLTYLKHPEFAHFAHAIHTPDLASVASHYATRLAAEFADIPDQSARIDGLDLLTATFTWGLDPIFDDARAETTKVLLAALDRPKEEDLHFKVYWNILKAELPEPHKSTFAAGLRERLGRIEYSDRTRGNLELWLSEHDQKD